MSHDDDDDSNLNERQLKRIRFLESENKEQKKKIKNQTAQLAEAQRAKKKRDSRRTLELNRHNSRLISDVQSSISLQANTEKSLRKLREEVKAIKNDIVANIGNDDKTLDELVQLLITFNIENDQKLFLLTEELKKTSN